MLARPATRRVTPQTARNTQSRSVTNNTHGAKSYIENISKGVDAKKLNDYQLLSLLSKTATEGPHQLYSTQDDIRKPVRVAVTGAAGQIGYSMIPRIASGEMLGPDQPVILHLVERPEATEAMKGVVMELQDCAFPLLKDIVYTSDMNTGFAEVDYALLVGAKPRGPGMERKDLLKENADIFARTGEALNRNAKEDALVLVVGNPANTNALITSHYAKKIARENITAMTRLDQQRAEAMVASKLGVSVDDIDRLPIWGNHSATQYPDLSHTRADGKWIRSQLGDEWISQTFIPSVQQRGAAIIKARGKSSAASAADAAIKHMRDWALGSPKWVSMGVPSDGSYGIPNGIYCSYPIHCSGAGRYGIIGKLPVDQFSAERINRSVEELFEEREAVSDLLK